MRNAIKLKKLELKKNSMSKLSLNEMKEVNGGLFGSRVTCFGTNADVGCTSHTRCNKRNDDGTHSGTVTILCID